MDSNDAGELLRFLKDCCENDMCKMCPLYFEKDYRKCRFRKQELNDKPDHVFTENEEDIKNANTSN